MNNEEIKAYVEDIIGNQLFESGLSREEVLESTMMACVFEYCDDKLTVDDLLKCADYLGYTLDIEGIKNDKALMDKREQMRKKRRELLKGTKDVFAHADITKVVKSLFKEVSKRGDFLYANCPFCKDKENTLSISTENGSFKCTKCDEEGSLIDLIHKVKRYSFKKSVLYIAEISGYENEITKQIEKELKKGE